MNVPSERNGPADRPSNLLGERRLSVVAASCLAPRALHKLAWFL